jgi:hypothetical protein
MGPTEEAAAFRALQARLAGQFERFRADPTQPYTAVVVPSQSVDPAELEKIEGVAHYEERALFNLMLLRHPRQRVVYVTSKRLNPLVVDYYLHQMRGVPAAHAHRRLTLLDCDDASARPLSEKILERPRLLARIREAIADPERAHLNVFNASPLERTLSLALGIPLNAPDPDLIGYGSKTGSRGVFRAAGIPMAPGREGLRDTEDLAEGIAELWAEDPDLARVVVKLNNSFSGEGNALLDLRPLAEHLGPQPSAATRRAAVYRGLHHLALEAPDLGIEGYRAQFDHMGGVCEAWIEGHGKRSPSAQLRINPLGEVQVVSTHDQVLGGPSGQVFLGATFPAEPIYRLEIQELGRRVGAVLASRGVIGRFGVDFLAIPHESGALDLYAVEINLRQGGTTHPFNILKLLTDGVYDEDTGVFRTTQGQPRAYFATDTLKDPAYRGLLPFDLLDRLVLEGMSFRPNETGVLFHLLGCLSEFGKLGCVCVEASVEDAKALYLQVVRMLDALARG